MDFLKDWIAHKKPNESSTYYYKCISPAVKNGITMMAAVDSHSSAGWSLHVFHDQSSNPITWKKYKAYDRNE